MAEPPSGLSVGAALAAKRAAEIKADLAAMDEPERKRMIAQLRGVLDRHSRVEAWTSKTLVVPITHAPE